MKKLFLTSQVQYVAHDISPKINSRVKTNAVFINTPLKDKEHSHLEWHHLNKASMEEEGFKFVDYDITGKTHDQIISDLNHFDLMYIEGGNSYYLLQESQKNGFGDFVKKRVEGGMVYVGTSAGTVIAGPDIEPVRQDDRAALAPDLRGTKGFGLVNFVVIPHWGQPDRGELFDSYRLNHIYQEDYPYLLINDHQYVEVQDDWFSIEVSKQV
ncbi:MAG: Type 1 glutamine amidotransferase-like domain-containing protein [bacterium]